MGRLNNGLLAVVGLFFACLVFGSSASAATPVLPTLTTSGSTQVVVTVQPIRSILINDQGEIVRIISNSAANVTPTVYKNSFTGSALELSPDVNQQYKSLLSNLDITRTGTIYQAGPLIIDRLARLGSPSYRYIVIFRQDLTHLGFT